MVAVASPSRSERTLTPVFGPTTPLPVDAPVLVAIPALNEERFIGSVVHEVRLLGFDCLVIDDGSTDRTSAIATAAGATVERREENGGKAAAVNVAFKIAREKNVSILVLMDGDWQHDPHEILELIEPIRSGAADVTSGSRFLHAARGHVPAVRSIGMRVLTLGSSIFSGQPMTDSLSGFRAFGRAAIEAFTFKSHGFSVEFEMQFMSGMLGLRHREIPITARYDDPAKRNVVSYGLQVLDGLLGLAARFRPLLFFGLPSTFLLLAGLVLGFIVVDTYQRTAVLAAGYALLTVLLVIVGSIGLFTAILLHVMRGIFLDLETQLRVVAEALSSSSDSA